MAIVPDNPEDLTLDKVKTWLEGDITNLLLALAAGLAIIMIIYGAYQYLTAYGNEEQAEKGKKTIMWVIIGLVVIIIAKLIINSINQGLGAIT